MPNLTNVTDKLTQLVCRWNSRLCVGLDLTEVPQEYLDACGGDVIRAYENFGTDVINTVAHYAVALKPNIAYYESMPIGGYELFFKLSRVAKEKGMFVIGDVKRADIGKSAEAYAKAYLGPDSPFDMITVNPYFGTDGVMPFVNMAVKNGKGIYVLVKTSNESADEVQDLITVADNSTVYENVATLVDIWGEKCIGRLGYSAVGMVVGGTHKEQADLLRVNHPSSTFLVPGYGAQGATAADLKGCFSDENGLGALVNSSSGIVYAYKKEKRTDYMQAIKEATIKSYNEINDALDL